MTCVGTEGQLCVTENNPTTTDWMGPSAGQELALSSCVLLYQTVLNEPAFWILFWGFRVLPPSLTILHRHFSLLSACFLVASSTQANLLLVNNLCLGKFIFYNVSSKRKALFSPVRLAPDTAQLC